MVDYEKYCNRNVYGPYSNVVKWNVLTTYCYMRKFCCKGCWFNGMLESQECRVKSTAFELYKRFGEPSEELKEATKEYY